MPLPSQRKPSASFLQRALCIGKTRTSKVRWCDFSDQDLLNELMVPISIAKTTSEHIGFWHKSIQPYIDKSHQAYINSADGGTCRADAGWNWPWLYTMINVLGKLSVCTYSCYTLGLVLPDAKLGELKLLPCGLFIIVWPREALSNHASEQKAPLLWYLTTAPENALNKIMNNANGGKKNIPDNLFCWGLHSGIILSYQHGYGGEISLHAAAGKCQEKLIHVYGRIGMRGLPRDKPPPKSELRCPPYYRKNDGGFFYIDADGASQFWQQMNIFV